MSVKQKALNAAVNFLKNGIKFTGGDNAASIMARLSAELAPILSQDTGFGTLSFCCPDKISIWRAQTLLTKEPGTIKWINTFNKSDIFWDIGANVGVYSMYAALKGLSVLAFEPSSSNHYLLNRNIEINKMDDRISALCIAFNDITKLGTFFMADTEPGSALNSFGEEVNWEGRPFTALFKQSVPGFSIDDFIKQFDPPFPNHIKIDVDGIESKIISGAKNTISDKRLKSILIELNAEGGCYKEATKIITAGGLVFFKKEHASIHSKFASMYNYIFKRQGTS